MINAWSLLYEELNGTMDKTYPIKMEGEMTDKNTDDITILGAGNTASAGNVDLNLDFSSIGAADTVSINTDELNFGTPLPGGMGEDHISFDFDIGTADPTSPTTFYTGIAGTQWDDPKYYATKPQPNLKDGSNQKYQEDKGIADLKSYVASTYKGHYTNENSDVQTLDLIHSVGDAESFCRSNALKYLSRYDKKGSAKNDILKAMHYCLLLYYFSGNTQEPDYTNTRYETF